MNVWVALQIARRRKEVVVALSLLAVVLFISAGYVYATPPTEPGTTTAVDRQVFRVSMTDSIVVTKETQLYTNGHTLTDREVYFVQASEILRLQGRIEVPAGYGPALTAETGEATLNKWRTNLHRGDGRTARCNATTKIHVRVGRARHRQCRRIPHRCNALEHGKPDGRLPGERRGWIGC